MNAGDAGFGMIVGLALGLLVSGAIYENDAKHTRDQCKVASRLDHLSNNVEGMALAIDRGMSVSQCKELIFKLGLESAEDADDARMWEK
jgi:hypothetical protein